MLGLSVSAINSSSFASINLSQKLTEETKNELQALGLDPSKYTTEAQGQKALIEAQAAQSSQATQAVAQPQHASHFGFVSSIRAEVETLAAQVGVSVGSRDKMIEVLGSIADKITDLKISAGTDSTKLAKVNSYQSQYEAISGEILQKQSSESKLTDSLKYLANYNKAALGLS